MTIITATYMGNHKRTGYKQGENYTLVLDIIHKSKVKIIASFPFIKFYNKKYIMTKKIDKARYICYPSATEFFSEWKIYGHRDIAYI